MENKTYLEMIPSLYSLIREFNALGHSFDQLQDNLDKAVEKGYDNQYIMTADEATITRLEVMYGIQAQSSESLTFRRRRLLAKKQERVPYNLAYLRQSLDVLTGAGLTYASVDYVLQELHVDVLIGGGDYWAAVWQLVEKVVPLELDITVAVLAITEILIITSKAYYFDLHYRYTGTFYTEAVEGMQGITEAVHLTSDAYYFDDGLPRTGTFYAGEDMNG